MTSLQIFVFGKVSMGVVLLLAPGALLYLIRYLTAIAFGETFPTHQSEPNLTQEEVRITIWLTALTLICFGALIYSRWKESHRRVDAITHFADVFPVRAEAQTTTDERIIVANVVGGLQWKVILPYSFSCFGSFRFL